MTKAVQITLQHSPTLNTVLMVEDVIKNAPGSIVTIAEIKRMLPRQVNHNTLKTVLEYLEESNKIIVSIKGITWIHNPNPNLRKAIARGMEL
jgi:predicted AAA+ superfamily ATPase